MLEHLYKTETGKSAKDNGSYTAEYVKWLENQVLDTIKI